MFQRSVQCLLEARSHFAFSEVPRQGEVRKKAPVTVCVYRQVRERVGEQRVPYKAERLPSKPTDRVANHESSDEINLCHQGVLKDDREAGRVSRQSACKYTLVHRGIPSLAHRVEQW